MCDTRCIPLCEPDILDIASGEVLAVTPKDHPYRIGATGWSESEARKRFAYALDRWEEMHRRGNAPCHQKGAE